MCNTNVRKNISSTVYKKTLNEFYADDGILTPVYANSVLNNPYDVKNGDFTSGVINNVKDFIDGAPSVTGRVIGYFAARKQQDATCVDKFIISMSFCAPEDYNSFNTRYARFLAMRKCLSNNCMLAHINKPQRVIAAGHWPIYCFGPNNTVSHQYRNFEARCVNYYV